MQDFFNGDKNYTGTKGLIFIGDKVLVYRRDNNTELYPLHIDVPGGGAEPNETPFETFRREVKEEFGLNIKRSQIVYSKRYHSSLTIGKYGWFAVAKLPENYARKINFGNEGTEYILMPLQNYLQLGDAWPLYQERAASYANTLN